MILIIENHLNLVKKVRVGAIVPKKTSSLSLQVLLVALICFLWPQPVSGVTADYTVIPLFSTNQMSETSSYFHLPIRPGQSETIHLEISNQTAETKEYSLTINEGVTNDNGVVDYIRKEPVDSTITYLMSELVSSVLTVEIPAETSKIVPLVITFPTETFAGIILGGIIIAPVKLPPGEGQVINHYTHTIAIVLEGTELTKPLEIKMKDIAIGQRNYNNLITVNLQNPLGVLINELRVTFEIRAENQQKIIYAEEKSGLRMAPNSNFDLPLLINDHFAPGNYEATVRAQVRDQEWLFTEKFTIAADEAEKLNTVTIDQKKQNLFLLISFSILGLVLGIILVGRMYRRRSK